MARSLPGDLFVASGARAVSVLGNGIALTALLLHLHDRGAGSWAVAGLLAAGTLPVVVLAPVVGLLIDRYDSRRLIVMSSLWQAATCLALAFASHTAAVLALSAVSALGAAMSVPVFGALTPLMVPRDQLAAATSVQQAGHVLALLAGPPLGGLLVGITGGVRLALLLSAASHLTVIALALLISARRRPVRGDGPTQVREGFRVLLGDGAVGAAMLLAVLLTLTGHISGVAQLFLLRDTFQASALAYGLAVAVQSLGVLFGTVLAGWLRSTRRLLLGCLLMAALTAGCQAGIGMSPVLVGIFVLHLVAGVGFGAVSNACTTLVLLRTRNAAIGRALASLTSLLRAAALIGQGLGGLALGLLAPRSVYLLSGGAALAATLAIALAMAPTVRSAMAPARS